MYFYLLANCFGALSYAVAKYFFQKEFLVGVKTMDLFFHVNFINLTVFFVIFFISKLRGEVKFSLKETFLRKEEIFLIFIFAIPILAAAYKTYMIDYMHLADIEISAMIKPFCVSWLGLIFLREKFYPCYINYGLLAILGFLIVNNELIPITFDDNKLCFSTAQYNDTNIWFLVSYLAIASIGNITRRFYCRKCEDTMQAVCVEFVMFALYGIIFLLVRGTFSFKVLFSPYALLVSLITILHHFCLIYGVKRAHSVTAMELVNFSKIIFTIIFSYLILDYNVPAYKMVGAVVIAVTLILFKLNLNKIKAQEEIENDSTKKSC
ncbi:MAG: hypothetical protein II393_04740 [Cytophagales bacterium]|nr:hypothetical protein [Cytophagales bacterium]